jgi:DNA-binding beta-propeller fold protein YncE
MKKSIYTRFPAKTVLALLLSSVAISGFAESNLIRKPVAVGAYEMVYDQGHHSLFIATTQNRNEEGGVVYELDAKTLEVIKAIKTAQKPFGAAINNRTHTAYFGGSIDGSLIAVDMDSGKVKNTLTLVPQSHAREKAAGEHAAPAGKKGADEMKKRDDHRPPAPRELTVDEQTNTVYVSGVNRDDSVLWIVDGDSMTLKSTLHGLGKLNTGLALDSSSHRLYTSNADGEFITLDTLSGKILSRTKIVDDGQEHLLMNIALDKKGHRAFIADNKAATLLVVNTDNGKVTHRINAPETLSVLFNPQRNEIYAAHRNAGGVSIIDGNSYKLLNTIQLPVHPNSLALAPQENALFVSVKQEAGHGKPASAPDDIVRISLN